MAYTALYRKWRPKKFEDVVGQKHITITLKNQIKNERIAHAYLLCGTRGTGKTSTAKILAKAVNCLNLEEGEPCNQCEMCKKISAGISMDVTELDAASHNGVDKIRDIIEDVQYPPQESRYKVYIIDEVHMLSIGAVNAFLKTLEEPPKNVIFILATTDPQKLPITILSRCQRFDFKRIRSEDIFQLLRRIVKEQGALLDDKSIELIARTSDGAMRDAVSILDQALSTGEGNITYEELLNMLGMVTNESLLDLAGSIIEKNVEKALKIVDEVVFNGKDIYTFIRDMITHFRNLMMVKVSEKPEEILDMSLENLDLIKRQGEEIRLEEVMRNIRILQEAEEQSKWSKQSRIYLELGIIKMCKIEYDTSKEILVSRINRLEEIIKQGKISVSCEAVIPRVVKVAEQKTEVKIQPIETFNENSTLNIEKIKKSWKDILDTFKARRHMVIYASLMTGKIINCSNGVVEIGYEEGYAFNKQRLEKEENKKTVEDIFSDALNERVRIKYSIDKSEDGVRNPEEILKEAFGEELEILDE